MERGRSYLDSYRFGIDSGSKLEDGDFYTNLYFIENIVEELILLYDFGYKVSR